MQFKSILTTDPVAASAAKELAEGVAGIEADLAVLFASHHYEPDFHELLSGVRDGINARNLIGCAGESIIGPDREIERRPAAVLWVAKMPGVRVLPFVLDYADLESLDTNEAWWDRIGLVPDDRPSFIIIPDPFSIPADEVLARMDRAFPGSPIVGGMASGAEAPGQTRLFSNDQVLRQGAVGVSLTGDVSITTVVSQGCRPVGKPYIITECRENLIVQLGGRSAYDVLKEVYQEASEDEQALMRGGVHVGRVINESLQSFTPGDFLVRNVIGVVEDSALAVGEYVRKGQTIQFHVRDARSADEEMRLLLKRNVVEGKLAPSGGLLFSCNGRGSRLFGKPDHDIGLVNEALTGCQVAGFFAAGEIGPVGPRTFVHGFTSSLFLFTPPK
jgi:small ligand-binding sensory domain FIST